MKGPEAIVESECVKEAMLLGLEHLKLRLLGTRGWPDHMFLAPVRRILFVEFKAPGETPREKQLEVHNILKEMGFDVYTIDSIKKGKHLLRQFAENKTKKDRERRATKAEHPEDSLIKQVLSEVYSRNVKCPKHTTGGGPCYCNAKKRNPLDT